jgi:hypothetical protein
MVRRTCWVDFQRRRRRYTRCAYIYINIVISKAVQMPRPRQFWLMGWLSTVHAIVFTIANHIAFIGPGAMFYLTLFDRHNLVPVSFYTAPLLQRLVGFGYPTPQLRRGQMNQVEARYAHTLT